MYNTEEIKNKVICGDNLDEMIKIPSESIDLIYLDPPFFSHAYYEKIWGDKDEVRSFEDRWEDGLIDGYIPWMRDRLKEMHRILKPTGSIYLHCDWHASHYLKIEMDKIFGYDNFQNEIVWSYSGGGIPKTAFPRKHDIILFYSKSDSKKRVFNIQYKPYSESTSRHTDGSPLNAKGTPITDSWEDLRGMSLVSKERRGYPTQKPEKLLERIIKVSSNEGDLILDPFCGCGTTVAVAKRLKRNFIGIDISPKSCRVISDRINSKESDIVSVPKNVDDLLKMKPHEFQQWICDKLSAKNTNPYSKESKKDGIIYLHNQKNSLFLDEKNSEYDGCPFKIILSGSINSRMIEDMMNESNKKDVFIVIKDDIQDIIDSVKRLKCKDIKVHLITLKKLLELKDGVTYNFT